SEASLVVLGACASLGACCCCCGVAVTSSFDLLEAAAAFADCCSRIFRDSSIVVFSIFGLAALWSGTTMRSEAGVSQASLAALRGVVISLLPSVIGRILNLPLLL